MHVLINKNIYSTSLQHFPLQRLETKVMADKDMHNEIDDVCRKTKTGVVPGTQDNCADTCSC